MLPRFWPAFLALGWILLVIAAGEAAMAVVAVAAKDGEEGAFALAAALTAGAGGAAVLATKGRHFDLGFRDAVILTVAAWTVVPFFASLPFFIAPVDLSPVDAYFEMVSALTTTGSTVMTGLDSAPPTILLWRSLVSWIGGVGIIGLAIAVLPFLKIGGMQLFRIEFSDRSEQALPRLREIARAVGGIYVLLTVACFLTYLFLGMSPFDALNHALTTVCTGGLSTHDASFGYFDSRALEWAAVVFMTLGALPFLAYLRLVRGRGRLRDRVDPQVIALFGTMAAVILLLTVWLHTSGPLQGFVAFTAAAFNTVSIVTTTGFASGDYLTWGSFATTVFFLLLFVGGCTGSTSGGIKILRFQIMGSMIAHHIRRTVFPHIVQQPRYGSRIITDEQIASVGVFVGVYLATVAVIAVLLALTGLDSQTALSGAATSVGNFGPGIGPMIGPAGSFAALDDGHKLILSAAMIMGRLEILAVLVLLAPRFYR